MVKPRRGDRIELKASAKRAHGGPAVIVKLEKRGKTHGFIVRRIGDFDGVGARELWVARGEFKLFG